MTGRNIDASLLAYYESTCVVNGRCTCICTAPILYIHACTHISKKKSMVMQLRTDKALGVAAIRNGSPTLPVMTLIVVRQRFHLFVPSEIPGNASQ